MSATALRGHVAPLLWHHGEPAATIVREIEAIASSGIREFILEPRPHPDYLGARWWSDVEVVLLAAEERGMRVWFWDDSHFPSGSVNGTIPTRHPELLKRHLGVQQIEVQGPATGTSLDLRPHLGDGLSLVAVVVARRQGDRELDSGTLDDVTSRVDDGVLYWDVPPGRWRVMVVSDGHVGEETETAQYINSIADGAAEVVLETIHEQHLRRFGDRFGGTVAGFFQDEPRFGNVGTYRFRLGRERHDHGWQVRNDVLPFSAALWSELRQRWGDRATSWLPLLWWPGDPALTAHVRFDYMDAVTRLVERFQRTLGDWCAAHGVELIGHVVEDSGAHARLGYGSGHYFRAMAGQHMGGIDIVQHVQPGVDGGTRRGTFGLYDDGFFHWGLAKLAASAAHIDPRKDGLAMCEAFGAYGWHAGLRLMKRVTDHLVVRGVNVVVPHAFSPRQWDPDCPPHFFNGGANPQWARFPVWQEYAERVTSRVSGGVHRADAAVLYHAEAEWAGEAMGFESVLAVLGREQRDADVVPLDALVEAAPTGDGGVQLGPAAYPMLIVPWAERQPAALAEAVLRLGIRTIVVDALPVGWADRDDPELMTRFAEAVEVLPLARLAERVPSPLAVADPTPWLRVMRYERRGEELIVLLNESVDQLIDTSLTLADRPGHPVLEDPMLQRTVGVDHRRGADLVSIRLRLEPGELRFLRFGREAAAPAAPATVATAVPADGWAIEARAFDASVFTPVDFDEVGPVNARDRMPRFAGVLRYSRVIDLDGASEIDLGAVGELAAVLVDGEEVGIRIAPPYRVELPARSGPVTLTVEVTTTLGPAKADNIFDAVVALEPGGLLGPVALLTR